MPTPKAFGQFGEQRQKERARSGAEVGDPQLPRARAGRIDRGERRLDDRFRLRARHQRRGIDVQRQAPEFLAADDTRDRFARQPAAGQRRDRASLAFVENAPAGGRQRGVIERQRMTDENAGIKFGRIDPGRLEFFGQQRAALPAIVSASAPSCRAGVVTCTAVVIPFPRQRAARPDARRPARRRIRPAPRPP